MVDWPHGSGEMAQRVRAHDWAATPLGPIVGWPASLRTAVDLTLGSPVATILLWGRDHIQIYNDPMRGPMEEKHPAALGSPARDSFHEAAAALEAAYQVQQGEAVVRLQTMQDTPWILQYLPIRDEKMAVAGILCTAIVTAANVFAEHDQVETALPDAEVRLEHAVADLQHRVRNILAVVRSIFTRTFAVEGSVESKVDHFQGRLDSLARTHIVMTQTPNGQVDLESLIRDELLSVATGDGPRVSIEGPEVMLPAKAAETLGLAIHELTTNALKYGALRVEGATLRIGWTTNVVCGGGCRLDIVWQEQGVPAMAVDPVRNGFGTELIEEALPYRLGAETRLEFPGGGVRCSISLPLSGAESSSTNEPGRHHG